jgi:two-component system sensor kinase FixL
MLNNNPSPELIEQLMNVARASALEEMASGIAHELNQPLGAIATFSQAGERMLKRPAPLVDSATDVFRHINHEAMSAGEGLRRIRRLFNRDHGQLTTHFMTDVVVELAPVLELIAARAGVQLEYSLAPDLPAVSIDHRQIQHVLFMLVQNALEASTGTSAHSVVQIQTIRTGDSIETAVIDGGAGIPVEVQSEIFNAFFSTKTGGCGLGLASSRTIVESHDGSIGFETASVQGTRFWFRLPMVNT